MNYIVIKILTWILLLGFMAFIIYFVACVIMDKCDNYESCGQPGDNVYNPKLFSEIPAQC